VSDLFLPHDTVKLLSPKSKNENSDSSEEYLKKTNSKSNKLRKRNIESKGN